MAGRGNRVIVTDFPRGVFEECIISGTPKPGTCMEVKGSTADVQGRWTYQAVSRASGAKGPICVLLEDRLQGFGISTAYVDGTRGFLYWPIAGEELNMLFSNQSGTADDVVLGTTLLGVETVTGKIMPNNSFASAPFLGLETVTDPTADQILWTKYLGNLA